MAPPLVRAWQARAELMAITGIGQQHAEVPVKAGVGRIRELREAAPTDLLHRIEKASEHLPARIQKNPGTEKVVEGWVLAARNHRP